VTVTEAAGTGTLIEPRLAGYTGYLLRLASGQAERWALAALPPGRDSRDLDVLSVLAERPVSQAQLGNLLEVNRTVMISVIDELEAAGLVRRERDPADRRRYALRITAEGRAASRNMTESADLAERRLTAPLGPDGHRRLNELLRLVIADLTDALPDTVTGRTGFLLEHSFRRLREQRARAMREFGIEPRCAAMLVTLDSAQPCTQERLAACMGVTSPTIVQAMDDFHAAGLIFRDRNPADRREHVLRLTPDGERYLTEALKAEDSAQRDLTGLLGERETAELNALLTALIGTGLIGPARPDR
jgi:DNA-binding MarR family transcriptional regulator